MYNEKTAGKGHYYDIGYELKQDDKFFIRDKATKKGFFVNSNEFLQKLDDEGRLEGKIVQLQSATNNAWKAFKQR